jgi:hypothetical protein
VSLVDLTENDVFSHKSYKKYCIPLALMGQSIKAWYIGGGGGGGGERAKGNTIPNKNKKAMVELGS